MNNQLPGKLFSGLAMCMLLSMALSVQVGGVESSTNLDPQHNIIARQWLAQRPWLRLATMSDCQNRGGLQAARQEYGLDYQPYYAVGDFNRDGQMDFAIAVVNQRKRSMRFGIAIFNGPFHDSRAKAPAFFTEGIDLSEGGLFVRSGNQLMIGVFQTDNCALLRPRGRTYVMQGCS